VALTAGLLVPGWCLLSVLGLKGLSSALVLPAAIGIGLSLVSVAAWLAWLTGTGMTGAVVLSMLAAVATVGARIVWRKHSAPMERPGRFELGAAALAVLAAGIVVVAGPWLGQSADTFYHMAAALTLLRENRAIPQDVFFGVTMPYPDVTSGTLHLALAWTSLIGGIVPAWVALSILGAPLLMLSFTAFAREATRSTPAALLAGFIYIVVGLYLDMRDMGYPDRIGQALGWLCLVFLLRFARSGSARVAPTPTLPPDGGRGYQLRELVPMGLIGFTAGSVYPGMTPFLVLIAVATLGIAVLVGLRGRDLRSVAPVVIACVALLIVVLPVLAVRLLAALPPLGLDATFSTYAPRLRLIVFHGYPFIDPRFWFGRGLISITTVGTACLLGRARRLLLEGDPGAALLWGGLLAVPALAVTPLLTGSSNEIYALARTAFLLSPLLYVSVGWGLASVLGLAATIRALKLTPRAAVPLIAALLLVAATTRVMAGGLVAGPIPIYLGHGGRSISTSHQLALPRVWADRLSALKAAGPGTILAGLETSYELAGLTGRGIVSVPRGHTPYQDEARDGALRRGDVTDALTPAADPTALLSVLFRYHVTFVMADLARDGMATWNWIAGQKELTTVAEGKGWRLYRFDAVHVDQALDIPVNSGAGLFPSRVTAGRAVFVRFTSPGRGALVHLTAVGLTSGATYQTPVSIPDQAGATFTAPLLLPDTARVDRYEVTVSGPGSASIPAGEVAVGHAYEAEFFADVILNYRRGFARNAGWEVIDGPAYSRGQAVSALRSGAVANHPLTEGPGEYCLSLLVFDAGDGVAHTLDVGLGGNVASTTWSGTAKGIRDLEMAASLGSSSHQITYWVPAGARVGAIADRITLYPTASDGTCKTTAST
jgi:hypothetical protein